MHMNKFDAELEQNTQLSINDLNFKLKQLDESFKKLSQDYALKCGYCSDFTMLRDKLTAKIEELNRIMTNQVGNIDSLQNDLRNH